MHWYNYLINTSLIASALVIGFAFLIIVRQNAYKSSKVRK